MIFFFKQSVLDKWRKRYSWGEQESKPHKHSTYYCKCCMS